MPEKANGFQNERHGNGAEEDYAAKLVVAAQAMERMMGGAGTNASAAPRPSDNAATLAAGAEASTVPIRHGTRNLLERVAPHIFRIDLPVPEELNVTNSYVVLGGKHNLVIDAGCNLPQTEEAFDEALSRLDVPWRATDVFLTHSDYDHCAGLTRIGRQGMIVYSGMEDYADRAKPALSCAPYTQAVERIGAEHDVPCNLDSDYWAPMRDRGTDDIRVSTLEDGDTLKAGDYRFECIATPGHDPYCICLYEPTAKILVAGDVLLGNAYPAITLTADEDAISQYFASLRKIRDLPCNLVLCGHGPEFTDLAGRVDETIAHHERQLDNIRGILDRGIIDPLEIAYATTLLPRRRDWADRNMLGRVTLIGQTMAYLRHLMEQGEYDHPELIVPK